MPATLYDDSVRLEALALRESGMPYRVIADRLGCNVATVWTWDHEARSLALAVPDQVGQRRKQAAADLLAEAQALAASRLLDSIATLPDPTSWGDAQRVAVITGIATDKYLDLTEGRRGGVTVNVDARTQTVEALRQYSVEELLAMRAAMESAGPGDTLGGDADGVGGRVPLIQSELHKKAPEESELHKKGLDLVTPPSLVEVLEGEVVERKKGRGWRRKG